MFLISVIEKKQFLDTKKNLNHFLKRKLCNYKLINKINIKI